MHYCRAFHSRVCYPLGPLMKGENKELWRELCEQAAGEQDPKKLLDLIKEINRLLTEKQKHLTDASPE